MKNFIIKCKEKLSANKALAWALLGCILSLVLLLTALLFPTADKQPELLFIPAESPSPNTAGKQLCTLEVISTQNDLFVRLRDESGDTIPREDTQISLLCPDQQTRVFGADSNGCFYLVGLAAGEYTVSLPEHPELYAESVQVDVSDQVAYRQIEHLENIVYVYHLEELYSPEELQSDMPVNLLPEVLTTPENPAPGTGWQTVDGKEYYYSPQGQMAVGLKEVDGKLTYFDQNGVKAREVGVDVSFYNETIDWDEVKAQGVDFVIIRVGGRTWEKGRLYYDRCASDYLAAAQEAGLKVGVYFYSTAVTELEAVQEASLALSIVDGRKLDYPIFMDMEYSGMFPDSRSDKLPMEQRAKVLKAFCETVKNSGYEPGVYSGQFFMEKNFLPETIEEYTVWLASYTADNRLPSYEHRYDLWQFTDTAQVRGIKDGVDVNAAF